MRGQVRRVGLAATALVCLATLTGCHGDSARPALSATTAAKPTVSGPCGDFTIAYDPSAGYEASAFIVGTIAEDQLNCTVTYVKTSSRKAWRMVADGDADVYLDAYGVSGLRATLAAAGGPVTIVGPNGVKGVVSMLAPHFMSRRGLATARDLPDVQRIGWGQAAPAITTVPALLSLARSFVDFQHLDYAIHNFNDVEPVRGMRALVRQPSRDDAQGVPAVYLAEAPRGLLGDRPDQSTVEVPASAAQSCEPGPRSTLCSLAGFAYLKIANSAFADSGSPAYSLVYNYRLDKASVDNILELVALSGYDVGPPDVASWLNTHAREWRRWLP